MLAPRTAITTSTSETERFVALWHRCVDSPPAPNGAAVYAELCDHYEQPHRRYHNLEHIRDCLSRVDEIAELLCDRDAVEFALWFHDAVYEIGAATNEWKSAELFLARAEGATPLFRRRVCGLILATRHAGRVLGNDRRYVVDIDLCGFGAPWGEFVENGRRLREESAAISDAQYASGQVRFLRRLQDRTRLYTTDYFHDRFEAKARANIARLLGEIATR
jgi:predicted metal-dependent HD superfamily phosphohydrolase